METETKKKAGSLKRNKMSRIFLVVMLALPVAHWLVFWLGVNFSSFIMAFRNMSGAFSFVNFQLFWEELTAQDGSLLVALKNTLKYFVAANFVMFPLTICMCYFLYKKIFCYKVIRIIVYIPAIISPVVMTGVFQTIVGNTGPLGVVLSSLGMKLPVSGLLGTVKTATATIIAYTMWTGLCSNMLLLSGAMARIPVEVLESAKLDGVGLWKELIYMIVPLMWPTISTLLLLSLTGLLTATGPILLLSSSPFQLKTQTISFWIFSQVYANGSINGGQYGLVAATGLCFTLVLVPIVFGARALVNKIPTVEY